MPGIRTISLIKLLDYVRILKHDLVNEMQNIILLFGTLESMKNITIKEYEKQVLPIKSRLEELMVAFERVLLHLENELESRLTAIESRNFQSELDTISGEHGQTATEVLTELKVYQGSGRKSHTVQRDLVQEIQVELKLRVEEAEAERIKLFQITKEFLSQKDPIAVRRNTEPEGELPKKEDKGEQT